MSPKKPMHLWLSGRIRKSLPLYLSKALTQPKPPPIPAMAGMSKKPKQPRLLLTPHTQDVLSQIPSTLGGKSLESKDEEDGE